MIASVKDGHTTTTHERETSKPFHLFIDFDSTVLRGIYIGIRFFNRPLISDPAVNNRHVETHWMFLTIESYFIQQAWCCLKGLSDFVYSQNWT